MQQWPQHRPACRAAVAAAAAVAVSAPAAPPPRGEEEEGLGNAVEDDTEPAAGADGDEVDTAVNARRIFFNHPFPALPAAGADDGGEVGIAVNARRRE